MTSRAAAFHAWASGFGIPAYAASSVPEDAGFPRLTYVFGANSFDDGEFAAHVDLWFRGGGEAAPNAKAEEISRALGQNGVILRCDGGALWLKRGTPFWQAVPDAPDIKRRYINISIESLTN